MTHEQLQDAHIAALREIVEFKATLDEQVEENRGLRSDVLLMQKEDAEQRALIEQQAKEIERLQAESEQLRMAVGLAATIKSDMEMRCDDPVGMMQEVHAYTVQLQAQLDSSYTMTQTYTPEEFNEIRSLKAQLARVNERATRMRSLLQRAQTIITLDANLYTIWREDALEELAQKKELT